MPVCCPHCDRALSPQLRSPGSLRSAGTAIVCPGCYRDMQVDFFPALFREPAAIDPGQLTLAEGDAHCYEHASKKAITLCNACGRFLCALCEVEIDGKVWCPSCLQPDGTEPRVQALESRRTLYDSVALALSTWPVLLFFYPCLLTAPLALFVAIRHWNRPSSLIPRSKWRMLVAVILSAGELALLAALVVAILAATRKLAVQR